MADPNTHMRFLAMPKLDSPVVDPSTGLVSIPWYRFFVQLFKAYPPPGQHNLTNQLVISRTSGTRLAVSADEIMVETTQEAGLHSLIDNLAVTFDATTVGPNGMDTGALPANGFLSLYAIRGFAKPDAVLGSVGSSSGIYSGTALPNGYTGSALIALWPVVGGALAPGTQFGRQFWYDVPALVDSGFAIGGALAQKSVASAVPPGAKTVSGLVGSTANASALFLAAGGPNGLGAEAVPALGGATGAFGFLTLGKFLEVPLATAQNLWLSAPNGAVATGRLSVTGFTF